MMHKIHIVLIDDYDVEHVVYSGPAETMTLTNEVETISPAPSNADGTQTKRLTGRQHIHITTMSPEQVSS